jgi:hypothetical protein
MDCLPLVKRGKQLQCKQTIKVFSILVPYQKREVEMCKEETLLLSVIAKLEQCTE